MNQHILNLDLSTNLDSSGIKYFDLRLIVTDEFSAKTQSMAEWP